MGGENACTSKQGMKPPHIKLSNQSVIDAKECVTSPPAGSTPPPLPLTSPPPLQERSPNSPLLSPSCLPDATNTDTQGNVPVSYAKKNAVARSKSSDTEKSRNYQGTSFVANARPKSAIATYSEDVNSKSTLPGLAETTSPVEAITLPSERKQITVPGRTKITLKPKKAYCEPVSNAEKREILISVEQMKSKSCNKLGCETFLEGTSANDVSVFVCDKYGSDCGTGAGVGIWLLQRKDGEELTRIKDSKYRLKHGEKYSIVHYSGSDVFIYL